MIKVVPCIFEQCLGPVSMLTVQRYSETGLFRHLMMITIMLVLKVSFSYRQELFYRPDDKLCAHAPILYILVTCTSNSYRYCGCLLSIRNHPLPSPRPLFVTAICSLIDSLCGSPALIVYCLDLNSLTKWPPSSAQLTVKNVTL